MLVVRFGSVDDPRKCDDWISCSVCSKWYHISCAEQHGVIDDDEKFTCADCLN